MQGSLNGATVAFLVANEGVEQVELTRPWQAVEEAGGRPLLVAPEDGTVQAFNHLDKGDTFSVDMTTADVVGQQLNGIVLPGGVANPDQLRMDSAALELVKKHLGAGRPLAAICHGPWVLVEAGEVQGRTLTSWPSLQTDIRNAGGNWIDSEVCVDGPLITSRGPQDLDTFCAELVGALSRTNVNA
ncbi:MAG: type 1 glutamine amidotransferase [Actinomycetota bacterium]|nr:type 1 glutamine amidotransferase [Actinomycetota bacterium]